MRLFLLLLFFVSSYCYAENSSFVIDIEKTVVKKQVEEGISIEEAVESMKLRANILNIKLVAELPLSKQIKSMGKSSRHIAIYQFCDPVTAKNMVEHDINFAAYLPCRISVVEDKNGKVWLVMMNLDMLLNGPGLSPGLKVEGIKIRNMLMEIMAAGVSGEL